MRISFDLDEVLFVDPRVYETEKAPRGIAGRFFKERLRKGTVELFRELKKRGFEVWIYTSSFRSSRYIERLFRRYGIVPDGIVNGRRHNEEVQRGHAQGLPQKMPSYYRISLHIDDEENIIRSGRSFGFRTFRVYEPDDRWVKKVLDEAERVRRLEEKTEHAHGLMGILSHAHKAEEKTEHAHKAEEKTAHAHGLTGILSHAHKAEEKTAKKKG